jgi:hypothetical protein
MVVAVDLDRPAGGHVEALQQLGERALVRAGRPHDAHHLAGIHCELEVLVEERQVLGVAKREMLDLDPPLAFAHAAGKDRIGFRRGVHDVADALHREVGLLELLPQPHQAQHRLGKPAGKHLEGDQHADGEVGAVHDGNRGLSPVSGFLVFSRTWKNRVCAFRKMR